MEWTEKELIYLRANYHLYSSEELAKALGRTKNSVIGKASRMGISGVDKHRQVVTRNEPIDPTPIKYQKRPDRTLFKLEDLKPNQCHYPYGVDDKEFCGLKREHGAYCEEHYKRCYR